MTEKPIIFSAPMINALLSGAKTQTRRVMKPQPADGTTKYPGIRPAREYMGRKFAGKWGAYFDHGGFHPFPYGQVGTRLWVRESLRATFYGEGRWGVAYVADGAGVDLTRENASAGDKRLNFGASRKTISSIHMPRWASRLTLEVTDVRTEKLNAISEEDAMAEGVPECLVCEKRGHVCRFVLLWQSIHGANSWTLDPWVWVIEFKRIAND